MAPSYDIGPLQRVINVGWSTVKPIGVLRFTYTYAWTADEEKDFHAYLIDSPVSLTGELFGTIGHEVAPPNVTPLMFKEWWGWNYPAKKTSEHEVEDTSYVVIDRAKYNIRTNRGTITSVVDTIFGTIVPFIVDYTGTGIGGDADGIPIIGPDQIEDQIEAALNIVGHDGITVAIPNEIEVISSHIVTGSVTNWTKTGSAIVFYNLKKIKDWIAPVNNLIVRISTNGAPRREFLHWDTSFSVWLGRNQFPVDANNNPIWSGVPVGFALENSHDLPETIKPPQQVTYTVNLTNWQVAVSREEQ